MRHPRVLDVSLLTLYLHLYQFLFSRSEGKKLKKGEQFKAVVSIKKSTITLNVESRKRATKDRVSNRLLLHLHVYLIA